ATRSSPGPVPPARFSTGGALVWKAPRSGAAVVGRFAPRWSVVMPATATPWAYAGLLAVMAMVLVGPPLAAGGDSPGSAVVPTGAPRAAPPLRTRSLLLPVKVGMLPPALVLATRSVTALLVWPRMSSTRAAWAVPLPGLVLLPPSLLSLRT